MERLTDMVTLGIFRGGPLAVRLASGISLFGRILKAEVPVCGIDSHTIVYCLQIQRVERFVSEPNIRSLYQVVYEECRARTCNKNKIMHLCSAGRLMWMKYGSCWKLRGPL